MRILLTNDDGFDAPGILALYQAIQHLGEVFPIAPLTVQSATSHGITFNDPLMTRALTAGTCMQGIAVDGRPADCVKLAISALWPERFGSGEKPDLTISGMNAGANVGINVLYSGTVAAAVESAYLGVPAIAVSLHLGPNRKPHFQRAAEIAAVVVERILEHPLDPHAVVNVNVPITESADAPQPPVHVTEMNLAPGRDLYERRTSPAGDAYYWMTNNGMDFTHSGPETDVEALARLAVSVTPLSYLLTDRHRLDVWRSRLAE
ncbi:MAG: 5'/3'-nucleotidase SurE [Phycisphaerales bacterium]